MQQLRNEHNHKVRADPADTLSMSVSRLISIDFSLEFVYDNATKSVKSDGTPGGPALRVMEVMGLGPVAGVFFILI